VHDKCKAKYGHRYKTGRLGEKKDETETYDHVWNEILGVNENSESILCASYNNMYIICHV